MLLGLFTVGHECALVLVRDGSRADSVAQQSIEEAIDRIYSAAAADRWSVPCDLIAALLAPAVVSLCPGGIEPNSHRLLADISDDQPNRTLLTAVRPSNQPDFTASEIRLFDALIPHLRQAMRLHWRLTQLELAHSQMRAVLDNLSTAVILLDDNCRVVLANHGADDVLMAGNALVVIDGRLRALGDVQQVEFDRAIAFTKSRNGASQDMAETALLLPRPGSLAPLTAVVHRLQPGSRWLTHLAATVAVHVIEGDPRAAVWPDRRRGRDLAGSRARSRSSAHGWAPRFQPQHDQDSLGANPREDRRGGPERTCQADTSGTGHDPLESATRATTRTRQHRRRLRLTRVGVHSQVLL
jgi:hypothetical protein